MKNYIGHLLIIIAISERTIAQMNMTTTTTTPAPSNIFQNVSVIPSQILNFRIPGARFLGLISLFALLKSHLGGGHQGFVGRCLGAARKLKMLMPFFIYKLGVIVTTLGFLTLFTLKGLVIGIILLVLNAGGWLGKLAFAKGAYLGHGGDGYGHHQPWYGKSHGHPVPVHIHVHKDRTDTGGGYYYSQPAQDTGYEGYYPAGYRGTPHSGPDYDPSHGNTWSERISKGFNVGSFEGKIQEGDDMDNYSTWS